MQWTYEGKEITEIPDGVEGFVYLITNLTNNKKYVGKKLAKFKTTKPPLKGKKKNTTHSHTQSSLCFNGLGREKGECAHQRPCHRSTTASGTTWIQILMTTA